MAFAETDILKRWLYKNRKWGKLVQTFVGTFYAGQLVGDMYQKEDGKWYGLIRNISRTKMGFAGLSDYVGYHTMIITPEMVGRKIAVAVCIEGKTPEGVVSDEQRHFINTARADGAIAFVVRSEDTKPSEW